MADTNTDAFKDGGSLTVAQFATAIRNKYPDSKLYKEKSDVDLTRAFIKSKPEYKVYEKRIKDLPPESFKIPTVGLKDKKENIVAKPPDITEQQRKEMKESAPSLKNLGKEGIIDAGRGLGTLAIALGGAAAIESTASLASGGAKLLVEAGKNAAKWAAANPVKAYVLYKILKDVVPGLKDFKKIASHLED